MQRIHCDEDMQCKEAGSGIKDNGRQGEERQTDPTVDFPPNIVLCDAVSE